MTLERNEIYKKQKERHKEVKIKCWLDGEGLLYDIPYVLITMEELIKLTPVK